MSKPLVRIENWSVVDRVIASGYQELAPGRRLTGNIVGHENLPNGIIYTSTIVSVDTVSRRVETLNTVYELGQVDIEYQRWGLWQKSERAA